MHSPRRIRSAFSLIELVIVVVIIGIIAAIAIPRMSRGAAGAGDSALTGDLAVMRKAIDLYAAEHGGSFPSATDITTQLTQYTDGSTGAGQASKDATHIYGPYLQKIPSLPVGANKNSNTILTSGTPGAAAGGWLYTAATGTIQANCPDTEKDAAGTKYNSY